MIVGGGVKILNVNVGYVVHHYTAIYWTRQMAQTIPRYLAPFKSNGQSKF